MKSITPISKNGITPELLANEIMVDAPDISEMFCVAFSKSGVVLQYHSGSAAKMAFAAAIMQEHALRASEGGRNP